MKFLPKTATISDAGGTANSAVISGLITEGIEYSFEDERKNIEDNQSVRISFKGMVKFTTANLTFDGGASVILDDSRVYSDPATDTLTKSRLVLSDGTRAITIDQVYLNGEDKILSTGEWGLMLDCGREDVSAVISYA